MNYATDSRAPDPMWSRVATSALSPAASLVSTGSYDVSAWNVPIENYSDFDSAIGGGDFIDGIHRIPISESATLDFYASGLSSLNGSDGDRVILVGLAGAVSERNGKKAPFFSGSGIARDIRLPFVAVSDPTLALDPELPLAWYAGSAMAPDLPARIATVLDSIAKRYRARLILFGGSGGGFAGLQLAGLLQCSATIVVWNPQTAIADYVPAFVIQYITAAFPHLREEVGKLEGLSGEGAAVRLDEILGATSIMHSVRNVTVGSSVRVLYLQNQSDWHVKRHAWPFMKGRQWDRVGETAFLDQETQKIGVLFGNWGDGHAPLPRQELETILKAAVRPVTVTELLQSLQSGLGEGAGASSNYGALLVDGELKISGMAVMEACQVRASCTILPNSETDNKLLFAFYLLVDGNRSQVKWYDESPHATFDISDDSGKLEVMAFVRDDLGKQVSTRFTVSRATAT